VWVPVGLRNGIGGVLTAISTKYIHFDRCRRNRSDGSSTKSQDECRKEGEKNGKESGLTSRNHPGSTASEGEHASLSFSLRLLATPTSTASLSRSVDFDHDFAFVDEEAHLHLAAVLRTLLATWWELDQSRTEEG
jgi:hypothetical protein